MYKRANHWRRWRGLVSLFLLCIVTATARAQQGSDPASFVWIEGEATTSANVKPNVAGWGRKEFLSGETWLHYSLDAEKVDKELPEGGAAILRYAFTAPKEADYEVWNRIGFEFVRSPFAWRIDDGPWKTVSPEELTTDLMELAEWTEVAWLKMGTQTLRPGAHTLEIRLTKTTDDKGKTRNVLYASDALCLSAGPFFPNSRFKPGDPGRDAKDEAAAKNVFDLPLAAGGDGARSAVTLKGDWEVARHDEQMPGETAKPILDFPARPVWKAIPVPSDKNVSRPDLLFAHRLWYRTRINVPAVMNGRSFHLVFPQNSLNTTVYVNGVYCGFYKNPHVRFEMDVTKGVKPGQGNEILVGIKDAWYGYATNPTNPLKLRKKFNLPLRYSHEGFQDLAYPVWNAFYSGILIAPEFVAAGPVRASDVFVKPSVAKKQLAVEVTVANPGGAAGAQGALLRCEVVNVQTGAVEKALPDKPLTLSGEGKEQTIEISGAWENALLWWPDRPHLYRLRTTVLVGGKPVDVMHTTFGFREWGSVGKDFTLNGIVWHGWADIHAHRTKEQWLAHYRKTNQRFVRLMGTAQGGLTWNGMTPGEALDFFDRSGVPVRRSGILDGEAIGYYAVETDPDLKKLYGTEIKKQLLQNWHDQMLAQVRAERNHPSIHVWSLENEWLYINTINLYGGLMDEFEADVRALSDKVRALDPTRLTMVDGGGAGKDNVLPVHGDHYIFDSGRPGQYPALAYERNPTGGGRGRWVWDQKRPRYAGEDFFATGINPFDYSYFGGEVAFQGKAQARPAAGIVYRMLTEGYRWAEYGAWHFWLGQETASSQYASNAPLAVFSRQWDWTFGAGRKVTRTLGVFNDTFHTTDPITLTWSLTLGGKKVAGAVSQYRVAPGKNEKFEIGFTIPKIAGARQEGQFILAMSVRGTEVFRDVKPVSVLNNAAPSPKLPAGNLLVFDPQNSVSAYLKGQGVAFTLLATLDALPRNGGRMLVIGRDALDARESASSRLAAWASTGRTVIVLEQKNPLRYQGLPADMETATNEGRTAFGEDLNHPALRGLTHRDFFTWPGDEIVYRNAYEKPTRGAKSLVQVHNRLQNSALVEVPTGKGLLLLSQLVIGEKIKSSPVAQRLLANLIGYGASYTLTFRPVALSVRDAGQLPKALDAVGVRYVRAAGPLEALSAPGVKIAVIGASPANLKTLAANLPKVQNFTKSGGWIVFSNLTPEGLADYNKIVGVDHMIRPFRQERVLFPPTKNPLTAGLTTSDIVMQSGKRINTFSSDVYLASDVFSYVVDYDEVAPFAKFPDPSHFGNKDAENDHNPLNMVNGFTSSDGWQYIFSIWAGGGGVPTDFTLTWPKPQTLTEIEWIGNAFYHLTTKVELTFDGRPADKVTLATAPSNEPQTFPINPPRSGRAMNLRIADWEKVGTNEIVGIDNIRLKAKRSPEFYRTVKPMLNIGAMMQYIRGSGGMVLSNVLFQENEAVPENLAKKRRILAAVLRNLKAPFAGSASVFAGANLTYTPLDISKQANQYRDDRGWFGDKAFTFRDMPFGRQNFGGVTYQIYEFPTSPTPTVIMLAGPNVPNKLEPAVRGIPVNRKADALFFLHTARLDRRRSDQEKRENKRHELFRYVVTYADGKTENIPIYAEVDIDDYRQKTPTPLPGAQIAWTRPFDGTEFHAVAYSKQWNNPRSGVSIQSIDAVYAAGSERRGVPVVLAITAAAALSVPSTHTRL